MIALIKNSVAAKVSLIISLMVFLSAFVVGGLLYYAGNSLVETNHFSDLENRAQVYSNIFYNEVSTWLQLGDRIKDLDQGEDSFKRIEDLLIDSVYMHQYWLGFKIFKGNGLLLSDQTQGFEPIDFKSYHQISSKVAIGDIHLSKGGYPYFVIQFKTANFTTHLYFDLHEFTASEYSLSDDQGGTFFFLFNKKGNFIYHPQESKRFSHSRNITYSVFEDFPSPEIYEYYKTGSANLHYKDKFLNKPTLFVFTPIRIKNKNVFHLILGETRRLGPFHQSFLQPENLIISLFMLLGFSFFGWFFTRYLLRNLDEITHQAKQFTQGEHDIDIQVRSGDEIGILALTFQGMIRQVNERTRILRKSERSIREARDQAEQALSSKSHLLEDLRKQKAEIERVSKDKDDLLAIVSHDLKNPLAVVETSMDLILEEEKNKLGSTAADLIRRSKNSARVALNLITDLLDLSRLEGGIRLDFERFNLEEMISSVVDGFYLKSKEKNITIQVNQEKKYDLVADYGRVIQVLSNLLGNSLKFTPKGGNITIDIKEYQSEHAYDGSYRGLELSISDTGPGIPQDKLESIFNKFEQARKKDRETGTGLGLTISRNICELHNGEITVDSPPGEGAIFTIRLPRLLLTEEIKEVGAKSSINVLVVNDEESFRKTMVQEFNKTGYQVIEAKNGEELLIVLEDSQPDLIILDSEMPVKDGLDALIELKDQQKKLPPIILCGDSNIVRSERFQEVKSYVVDVIPNSTSVEEVLARSESLMKSDMSNFDKRLDPQRKTILIVDDEEGIRTLMQESLSSNGYNSMVAKSGIEAMFLVQKYNIDMVISDIRMSEGDGLKLTKSIHNLFPDIKVLLMSANVENMSENLKQKLGVSHLFSKPFDIDEVCDVVDGLLKDSLVKGDRPVLRQKEDSPGLEKFEMNDEESSMAKINKSILLVDDSEDMQTLFKVLLRKENLDLEIASNGSDAVGMYKENKYDTVFLDMNMPIMGGEEAAKLIREYEKSNGGEKSHLVLLTADTFGDREEVKKMGFDSYLQKPLNKEKILKEIFGHE